MAMGLNPLGSGSVRLQAVNLEGKAGRLGELQLQEAANRTGMFVAELPPALLTGSSFSIVLRGVDSEGQKVERAAPQVATVLGTLLEVRQ